MLIHFPMINCKRYQQAISPRKEKRNEKEASKKASNEKTTKRQADGFGTNEDASHEDG
jgi:hypothetical protein